MGREVGKALRAKGEKQGERMNKWHLPCMAQEKVQNQIRVLLPHVLN